MKRFLCLILALGLLLSGCGGGPGETTAPTILPSAPAETDPIGSTPPPETTLPTETTQPATEPDSGLEELREHLPIMDGSTSLIPLEAGIRAALFGISQEEARQQVSHTTSWESFFNLLLGRADLIFSVPLSADQEVQAMEQGVLLEAVPIAMEGFVFVVNAENPVDTLTRQQLKDIYSGKITNWSQVGGLDEEIIPYQRNYDSGSQNYMRAFMGSTPLMDAPSELRPASMEGLMDVIAVNDNARGAIGYSVYAYAADMYGNGNEIKFIRVDGVAPSKATFADGSYPLLGQNFAVFRASEPEDSYVRKLVDWMLTDQGQLAIAKAGYVTVRDIGYRYTEDTLKQYQGVGKGSTPLLTAPAEEYVPLATYHEVTQWGEYDNFFNELSLNKTVTPYGTTSWHISQLTDTALQATVNQWIDDQMVWYYAQEPDMIRLVNQLNASYDYSPYGLKSDYGAEVVPVAVSVKNGYLYARVSLCYVQNTMDTRDLYYRTETAVWDIHTGWRLTPEELFCLGVDIDQALNTLIREYTQGKPHEFFTLEMVRDFTALPETGWHITPEGIYIDHGHPDFLHGEFIPFDNLPDGILASANPRDFSDCLVDDGIIRVIRRLRLSSRDLTYARYSPEENFFVTLLKEGSYPTAEKINAELMSYAQTYYSREAVVDYFTNLGFREDDIDLYWRSFYGSLYGGRYLLVSCSRPQVYVEQTNSFVDYPYPTHLLYDIETGAQLEWTQILREGWLSASTMRQSYPDILIEQAYYEGLETEWFQYENMIHRFTVCLTDGENSYFLSIPGDYLIF